MRHGNRKFVMMNWIIYSWTCSRWMKREKCRHVRNLFITMKSSFLYKQWLYINDDIVLACSMINLMIYMAHSMQYNRNHLRIYAVNESKNDRSFLNNLMNKTRGIIFVFSHLSCFNLTEDLYQIIECVVVLTISQLLFHMLWFGSITLHSDTR